MMRHAEGSCRRELQSIPVQARMFLLPGGEMNADAHQSCGALHCSS